MKRLISTAEAVDLGLMRVLPKLGLETRCIEQRRDLAAIRLWRSRKGYRKACRLLRRAGASIELRQVGGRAWRRIDAALAAKFAPALAAEIMRPNPILEAIKR